MRQQYDVIVIGVGSMGSAAACHLARRGARVLGLERFDVPNALGAFVGVNRIIRLAYAEHPKYVPLLRRAYESWRDLEKAADERLLVITGSVDAGAEESAIVAGSLRACREHQLPFELLSAVDLRRKYPGYTLPPDMVAVYQPDGGFLMSERCVVAHASAAMALGAEIHGRERVLSWMPSGDGVDVVTDRGSYQARRLVITAGPWTADVAPELSRRIVPERQVQLWVQPAAPEYFTVDRFPVFNLDAPEGRFYGFPVHHVPGFKVGKYHHRHEQVDADGADRDCYPEDESIVREGIRRYFPQGDGPTLAMKVCLFANTPDEHFVIDRHPDAPQVVIAAGFSGHGFKFCSVVGEILADLLLEGATAWDLDLFRLDRAAMRD